MRSFQNQSYISDGTLSLALAPALTPNGVEKNPDFYQGLVIQPQVMARGLLTLADISATRYFHYTPVVERDPILSAQGDRLRIECFSACNGVYARLDLLQDGLEGAIGLGTTNVDIGMQMRTALTSLSKNDMLHLSVGNSGLGVARYGQEDRKLAVVHERPVKMPDRWIRALGNAALIHKGMRPVFDVQGPQAQMFIASLPAATSKQQSGWLTYTRTGVRLLPNASPEAVYISGLHRLSAMKRIMTEVQGLIFYAPTDGAKGPMMIEALLPNARLTLSLTAESWQGYSGEGALLESLATEQEKDDMQELASTLCFDADIELYRLSKDCGLSKKRVDKAIALLACAGKVGYDVHDNAYFHRQLPDDESRVDKDNPRLVAARKLVDSTRYIGDNRWLVSSNGTDYRVTYDPKLGGQKASCTCTWYMKHMNEHGLCKHILAVKLKEEKQ